MAGQIRTSGLTVQPWVVAARCVAALLAVGCAHPNLVPRVRVGGGAIVVQHPTFQLTGGQEFATPFWARGCPPIPTPTNFDQGERLGARRVVIQYPGLATPLYGMLAFCPVDAAVDGPVSRSYALQIPEAYVAQTAGDQYSVVFERQGHVEAHEGQRVDLPAWILWLSRSPFPGGDGGGSSAANTPAANPGGSRYERALVGGVSGRWIPSGATLDGYLGYRFARLHELQVLFSGAWYQCAQFVLAQARYVYAIPLQAITAIRVGGSAGVAAPTSVAACGATGRDYTSAFTLFGLAGFALSPARWLDLFVDVWLGVAVPSSAVVFVGLGGGASFAIPL